MPRIPTDAAYADSSAISALAPIRGQTPGEAAIPGQQIQEFGSALMGAGTEAMSVATDMQIYVNQVQIMDAVNKARQKALDLTFDPQSGYQMVKGEAAIRPQDDGTSLADSYTAKFRSSIQDISAGLSNEAQRQEFALKADTLSTEFRGDVQRHLEKEFKDHTLSVADGTIKLSTDEAKRNWNNPDKIEAAALQIKTAIVRAGQINGWSASETKARMMVATSNAHASVIESALQSGNPTYANSYMQKYSSDMTADDLLKANGLITKSIDAAQVQSAIISTKKELASEFAPTDKDVAWSAIKGRESRGRQFNDDGSVVTSPKGAIGIAQVMPSTGPEAAKLAGLPWDPVRFKTDAAYNEALGRAYFEDQLRTFKGNLPMAMAAYNAGPGAVQKAMAKAADSGDKASWLTKLPDETQKYVAWCMDKYRAGGANIAKPTESEFIDRAVAKLGPNPRPELAKSLRDAAEHEFSLMAKSEKQTAERATSDALQSLIKVGGDFNAVPPAVKQNLARFAPDKFDDVMQAGRRMSREDTQTDNELFMGMMEHPERLAQLQPSEFLLLKNRLSDTDFKAFEKMRAEQLNGKEDLSELTINGKAFRETFDNRMTLIGMPKPKPADKEGNERYATAWKFAHDFILDQQKATGARMMPADITKAIDGLFIKNVEFRRIGLFGGESVDPQRMMTMKFSDLTKEGKQIAADLLAQQGNRKPTNDEILRAYWKYRLGADRWTGPSAQGDW
jgi:soluble lytic murein transglycosylase